MTISTEDRLNSLKDELVGLKIKSLATGMEGVIINIVKDKLVLSFLSSESVPINVDKYKDLIYMPNENEGKLNEYINILKKGNKKSCKKI